MPIWTYTPLKTIVSGYTKALGTAMIEIIFVNKERRGYMGLFDKGKTAPTEQDDLLQELDEVDAVNHNSVLDYMLTLSDEDYDKLLKAAKIYREANRKVAEVMGVDGVAAKAIDGEKVEVRVEKSTASDFIETDDDKKGKKENVAKTK